MYKYTVILYSYTHDCWRAPRLITSVFQKWCLGVKLKRQRRRNHPAIRASDWIVLGLHWTRWCCMCCFRPCFLGQVQAKGSQAVSDDGWFVWRSHKSWRVLQISSLDSLDSWDSLDASVAPFESQARCWRVMFPLPSITRCHRINTIYMSILSNN